MGDLHPEVILSTLVYSAVGILVFGLCFFAFSKIAPFSLRKEIEEDQNTAVAIIIGAMFIGLAQIISAAIGG